MLSEIDKPISRERHLITTAEITPLMPGAGVPATITPHTSCRISTIIIIIINHYKKKSAFKRTTWRLLFPKPEKESEMIKLIKL